MKFLTQLRLIYNLNTFRNILIRSKTLFIIFFVVAALIIVSAYYELNRSKREMLELMSNQAHSLLETVMVSSQEVLYAANEVEEKINIRLLNNANIIKILLDQNGITNSLLKKISNENDINRINIFNKKGKKIFQSFTDEEHAPVTPEYIKKYLKPIFNNEKDTLIIGLKKARIEDSYRYVAAIASENNDAIVLNLEADELLEFKKRIGFGILIKRLIENEDVVYAALESESGILAASENVDYLEDMNESDFLIHSFSDSTFVWRITEFNGTEIFEAVHPFAFDNNIIGLYRIGLSLEPLNTINSRLTRRIIISGLILFVFGSIIIALVFVRQNLSILKRQYKRVESYSNKLIKSVSDAVIVLDNNHSIIEFNTAASVLFEIDENSAINKPLNSLFQNEQCNQLIINNSNLNQLDCRIKEKHKFLLISKSEFIDENELQNIVLVIKDLTKIKNLENQIARNEQLKAMGELASGVAHEIRNPLNTIGTIAQQLEKDFIPMENEEEFRTLSRLVYKEVRRINKTIQNFLRFSKPEPINKTSFKFSKLLKNIETQYYSMLKEKGIVFDVNLNWDGIINLDYNQFKQVLMNLIQNSSEAIDNSGSISVEVSKQQSEILISLKDNGIGIPKENIERIFNLYYTTKAEGTGIGLSIIQRIINEHDGTLTVESEHGVGTTFKIKIPIG